MALVRWPIPAWFSLSWRSFRFGWLQASAHRWRLLFVQVFGLDVGHGRHRRRVHLVQVLERFVQKVLQRTTRERQTTGKQRSNALPYLDGGEGGNNGWAAESVRDEREVRQVTLNVRFQDDLRPRVAQRRSVLVEQVHQLFGDLPRRTRETGAFSVPVAWFTGPGAQSAACVVSLVPADRQHTPRGKGSRYLMRLLVLFDAAVMYYYDSSPAFFFS